MIPPATLGGNLSRFIVTLLKYHVKSYSSTVSETQSMVHHPTTIHRKSNMADTVAVGIEIEIIKHLFAVPKSKLHP